MIDKNVVGHNIGKAPVTAVNDSFFTAIANGFSSDIIHAKHKAEQASGLLASYEAMGYSTEEAAAIVAGG
jgi:hypothetical protein